jgi:hypothetical protein
MTAAEEVELTKIIMTMSGELVAPILNRARLRFGNQPTAHAPLAGEDELERGSLVLVKETLIHEGCSNI